MKKIDQPISFIPKAFPLILILSMVLIFASCSPEQEGADLKEGDFINAKANLSEPGVPELFLSGIQGGSGSTIGPGGDLFVTEGALGEISRIDLKTGERTTYASGLPPFIIGIGGVTDVVFIGSTAYALVTLVGPQFGTNDVNGIYRIDGPDSFTVIADLGEFSLANPPVPDFFVERGVQYSIEFYRGGFLVADGHHNRVLYVTRDGEISVFQEFGNIVPTGLDVSENTVYMAEAGPVPHEPEDGKVVTFGPNSSEATTVATGARLLVDVEVGRGRILFALSQGIWDGAGEGSPALPNTGSLLMVNNDGGFNMVAEDLDRPTSMEIFQNTAYIVTLAGEIWKVENIASQPFGK